MGDRYLKYSLHGKKYTKQVLFLFQQTILGERTGNVNPERTIKILDTVVEVIRYYMETICPF